jgi:hypothetical protein
MWIKDQIEKENTQGVDLAGKYASSKVNCITCGRTLGNKDVLCYNVPMANEVAMIIVGEPGEVGNRDVIIQGDMEVVYSE